VSFFSSTNFTNFTNFKNLWSSAPSAAREFFAANVADDHRCFFSWAKNQKALKKLLLLPVKKNLFFFFCSLPVKKIFANSVAFRFFFPQTVLT